MTGVELLLVASLASTVGSGVMAYKSAKKEEDINDAARAEEQSELKIQSRLEQGDTLAQVSGLGVSSKSASISKFLIAQRAQLPRDLQRSRQMGEMESDLFKYNKGKAIFDTASAITSAGYTYKTRPKPPSKPTTTIPKAPTK
jgi:hypothetical protein